MYAMMMMIMMMVMMMMAVDRGSSSSSCDDGLYKDRRKWKYFGRVIESNASRMEE